MAWTRRELLGAAAASVALAGCGGTEGPPPRREAPPEPEPVDGARPWDVDPAAAEAVGAPFGVQAGAPSLGGALLTTWADGPRRLSVWRERASGERLLAWEQRVEPVGGVLRAPVSGLGAGWYRFAFFSEDGRTRGPIGRFRTTFAAGDLRPLTLGGLTCTNIRHQAFPALADSAALDVDAYVHLGDLCYADGAVTQSDYVDKYRATFAEGNYPRLFERAGYYYTWDDHEFGNNFDPTAFPAEQLAAARQAAFDVLAIPHDDQGRIWRSTRWGDTAEIFVLDGRTERRPETRETGGAVYLSEAQQAWLEQAILASPCRFKIILNSVPMTQFPAGLWDFAVGDRWQGYQAARARLLGFLEQHRVGGVVFLSGDFHCGFVSRVQAAGWASRYYEIAVGPTGNGPNPLAVLVDAGHLGREEVFPSALFAYGSGVWPATTALTFDPLNGDLRVRFVDARPDTRGAVLFDERLAIEA